MRSLLLFQLIRSFTLYSEFYPDHGAVPPREILSPGVARNAYFTLTLAVTAERNANFFFAIQSNPSDIFRWKLYKKFPNSLEEKREPYFDALEPYQTEQLYLLDVWVPAGLPEGRYRLEALIKSAYWRVNPMEVRVLPVTVPNLSPYPVPSSPADLLKRNAAQDEALAKTLPPATVETCRPTPSDRDRYGAEAALRFRDCLFRNASKPTAVARHNSASERHLWRLTQLPPNIPLH